MAKSARGRSSLIEMLAEGIRMPPLQYFDLHVFVQINDVYFLDTGPTMQNRTGSCCRASRRW